MGNPKPQAIINLKKSQAKVLQVTEELLKTINAMEDSTEKQDNLSKAQTLKGMIVQTIGHELENVENPEQESA